jgi:hypothetical protein
VRSGGFVPLRSEREDEKMGETFRGSATQLTEQRTDQMIMVVSIALVLALAVGGFIVAVNSLGDQNENPVDNQQIAFVDDFDLVETARLESERETDFVLGSYSGEWVFDTEQGSIEIRDFYFPEVMPLCLTQEELDMWFVDLVVIGGYELVCGYIDVYQKGIQVGTIYLDWTVMHDDVLCCVDYYHVTFWSDPICLDSNQYPDVCAPFDLCAPYDTIPGKEVTFDLYSCWAGCEDPDQNFAITPTQSLLSFSKSLALSQNGKNPVTLPKQSEHITKQNK